MNTEDLMELSLRLADMDDTPPDSAIYVNGDSIKNVLFCIDAGAPELLMAKHLGYDAVIAHHPIGGTAAINLHQVFRRHVQQMTAIGIPRYEAERIVSKKSEQLEVESHTRNYDHAVDVARRLSMPFMNIHTPLDEIGRRIMSEHIENVITETSTVQQVVSILRELAEFKKALTEIKIRLGKAENLAGKVIVSHGAGTNGGYEIAKAYFEHGISTVIYIHVSYGDLEKLKAEKVGNLIVTGHVASDSVGINPFVRELRQRSISVTTIGVVPS